MSMKRLNPTFIYSKTEVYMGIPIFLIRLTVPTIYVLSKNKKNIKTFLLKFFIFYNLRKICILHGYVFVMSDCIVFDSFGL